MVEANPSQAATENDDYGAEEEKKGPATTGGKKKGKGKSAAAGGSSAAKFKIHINNADHVKPLIEKIVEATPKWQLVTM